jgi:mannose-1-phosphate guanylyltransferase
MIYGVIMAGGSGTRFWPESRRVRPKQLLKIADDKTMIRATVERIKSEISADRVLIVTTEDQASEIRTELSELGDGMVVAEPMARNTAACVALAAYKLQKMDPEALMVVLPADHLIRHEQEFLDILKCGIELVSQSEYLVTFGIVPHRPETGYGYIQMGGRHADIGRRTVYQVNRFVEKPDLATARSYVESGSYLWNSGMFVWKASDVTRAFDKYLPSLSAAMREILPHLSTADESDALQRAYRQIESVSIDYGIMERADNVLVIPMDVGWNDVGCWASIEEVWSRDETGNAARGELVAVDSTGCIVSSPHKLTTIIGVDDLIVVDTPDALLICSKERAQEVRRVQEILRKKGWHHLL